jgi:hypothetical protein
MDWISKADRASTVASHPKQIVSDYLERCEIVPHGYLQQVLDDNWEPALRHVAYCTQIWPEHPGIRRKIAHLANATRRGRSPLQQEINTRVAYSAGLFELKVAYALHHLLGYELVGCDAMVGGTGPHSKKNCDLTVKADGAQLHVRVDAKRWSLDDLSKRSDRHYDPVPKDGIFSARWKIGAWLRRRTRDVAREKQAQILVVRLPEWEHKFSKRGLKAYCDEILPGVLSWGGGQPVWRWRVAAPLKEIVVVGSPGCWKIVCAAAE